jgi:hypothetical protein
LEDVAEAIILDRNPKLADPGLEPAKKEKVEKQIKQLLSREKASKMYRKIGKVLNKVVGKGLSRIDVPDAATKLLGTQISLRLGKALGGP